MSIKLGKYLFNGPYKNRTTLRDRAGVYAILCKKHEEYQVLDIIESDQVRTSIERHDRKDCWADHCGGEVLAAVYYTPDLEPPERAAMERELRQRYSPPCGDR